MSDSDPAIIESPLSRTIVHQDIRVELNIFRIEGDAGWAMEVVNVAGTSTVWDDVFDTDEAAYAVFLQTVASEGMATFVDDIMEDASATRH